MIPIRIVGMLSFCFGVLLGILGVDEAESKVVRIGTMFLGNLAQSTAQLLAWGFALIIIGIVMMVVNFRRAKA